MRHTKSNLCKPWCRLWASSFQGQGIVLILTILRPFLRPSLTGLSLACAASKESFEQDRPTTPARTGDSVHNTSGGTSTRPPDPFPRALIGLPRPSAHATPPPHKHTQTHTHGCGFYSPHRPRLQTPGRTVSSESLRAIPVKLEL
jgi:hypothetical protein